MIETTNEILKFIANVSTDDYADELIHHEDSIGFVNGDGVKNSKPKAMWDLRYNTLVNEADKYGLRSVKINRGGLWTAITIYNPCTKELLMIFKEDNLINIMKKQSGSHYYPILNTLNDNLRPHYGGEQLNLFEIESPDDLKLDGYRKQLSKMLDDIEVKPDKVIAFGFNSGNEKSFKAYIFNDNQDLVFHQDYSDLIETNFVSLGTEDNIQPETVKEEKHNIKLKTTRRIKGLK